MPKILITLKNVKDYIDSQQLILPMTSDMIITPSAMDYCRNKLIKISYVEEKNSKTPTSKPSEIRSEKGQEQESLEKTIKQMLRNEFNIVKEAEVQQIAKIVLQVINSKNTNG